MAVYAEQNQLGYVRLDARLPHGFEMSAHVGGRLVLFREGEEHGFPRPLVDGLRNSGLDVRWARVKRGKDDVVESIDDGVVQGAFHPSWFSFSDSPRGNRTDWSDVSTAGIMQQIPGKPWCEATFPFREWPRWDSRVKVAFCGNALAGEHGLSKETALAALHAVESRVSQKIGTDPEK